MTKPDFMERVDVAYAFARVPRGPAFASRILESVQCIMAMEELDG